MNGELVPGIQWRVCAHAAGTRPFKIEHAFSRFRNRAGTPEWVAQCNRTFSPAVFSSGESDGRCEACRLAVSSNAAC